MVTDSAPNQQEHPVRPATKYHLSLNLKLFDINILKHLIFL